MEAVFSPAAKKSKGHKCYFCGQRFVNVHVLRKHVGTHMDRDFKCEVCSNFYSNRQSLKKHMMQHTGERPHSCHICGKGFIQKHSLHDHMQSVHILKRPGKAICSTCGANMRSYDKVSSQCWFCKYSNVERKNVDDSSSIKEEDNMPTAASSGILENGPIDDGKPIVEIEVDGNDYQDEKDLSLKVADNSVQSEPKKVQTDKDHVLKCKLCSKVYSTIWSFQQHIILHTGERRYSCHTCEKAFTSQTGLKKHVMIHTGERPHSCHVCEKAFIQKHSLLNHLQSAHNLNIPERPTCSTCGAKMMRSRSKTSSQFWFCKCCKIESQNLEGSFSVKEEGNMPAATSSFDHKHDQIDLDKPFVEIEVDGYDYQDKEDSSLKMADASVRITKPKKIHIYKDRYLKCEVCSKFFSNRQSLKKHMMLHTGERPHTCHICGKGFIQKHSLRDHMQSVHILNRPEKAICSTCGANMRSHDTISSQCWFCKYSNVERKNLDDGFAKKGEDNMPTAASAGNLENGPIDDGKPIVEIEVDSNDYQDEEDSSLKIVDDSVQSEPKKVHTCLTCCETFLSITDLRRHVDNMHKNLRPFLCVVCGRRFAMNISLTNHAKTHEEDRPHACLTCGKSFKKRICLQNHLKTHKKVKPFPCKICSAQFTTIFCLKKHIITHQKERPFKCKDCSYTAKTVEQLKRHTLAHSDETPYKCRFCEKGFKSRNNLARHHEMHEGKRLYVCKVCGKDFNQYDGLKLHQQIHDKRLKESKKLPCPMCNKKYKLEVMLLMHLKTHN